MPAHGPEPLGEILGRLFLARGWGRKQERLRLEQAWEGAVAACGLSPAEMRPGAFRRGVLQVVVGKAVLLQELAHFHRQGLLEELRRRLPGTTVTGLRFRLGV